MTNRRTFLRLTGLAAGALAWKPAFSSIANPSKIVAGKPIVISTWKHGMPANSAAWKILSEGGHAIDAVEKGVMVVENDPESTSVGYGGLPDREGHVTLDACIMDHKSNCGAVAFLQNIKNPIAVARKVMDETPHVMLVGKGAFEFALEKGFKKEDLLTDASRKKWQDWLKKSKYQPQINSENHDTIGMLALDNGGHLAGSCTTSGAAWKLHGRVGDSPIIGSGLFLDGDVGGACATGLGEAVIRVSGSAMVVELMRQGVEPEEACKQIVERIKSKHRDLANLQVGFLALRKDGAYGGYSIYKGFDFALRTKQQNEMIDAQYELEWD